jgi:uncharacterized protein (DUF433 family)
MSPLQELPHVTYRRGASGHLTPILRGTGIRVQTIVIAITTWQMSPAQICEEYDLTMEQVQEALAFFEAVPDEIEMSVSSERQTELAACRP